MNPLQKLLIELLHVQQVGKIEKIEKFFEEYEVSIVVLKRIATDEYTYKILPSP